MTLSPKFNASPEELPLKAAEKLLAPVLSGLSQGQNIIDRLNKVEKLLTSAGYQTGWRVFFAEDTPVQMDREERALYDSAWKAVGLKGGFAEYERRIKDALNQIPSPPNYWQHRYS